MTTLFRLFLILLFLAVATPVVLAVAFWSDQGGVVARAEQAGVLRQPETHLNTVERTIAVNSFSETWGRRAFPCRTIDRLFTDMTSPDVTLGGQPVSQALAARLYSQQSLVGTSIRGHVGRLVVACQLEQRYSDTRMFRAWLADATFGQGLRGVEAASQAVFQKPSASLNDEEAAKLAALLRNPGLRTQPDQWTQAAQRIQARVAPH